MRIWRPFRLPVVADEEQMRRARVLHFIVWSLLFVFDTQFFVLFFILPQNWPRWLFVLVSMNVTLVTTLFLNHKNRTRVAGKFLLAILWLLGTIMALTAGGVHAPAILMYAVNVLIAGLLFGGRAGVIAAVIFGITAFAFELLEMRGLLPANKVSHTTLSIWVTIIWTIQFVAIFQFLANRSLRAAYDKARQAEAGLRRANDELEARVKERTADLQKINQELEAFSYSVSHDLRRPLRAVRGFADLLMLDHSRELSRDAQESVTAIKEGADEMNGLIDTLLHLSRIDRQPLTPRRVNLTALARQTIEQLRAAEPPERKMDIHIADLPDCMGDPDLLRQVLVNLLSNAFKFTGNRPVSVIEVGSKTEHNKIIYFVRDNGAGFDMRDADKLFGVFQRLHSSKQFKGTGVGLSIVKRIIHRHGGTIWAESAVDQGATFYFTLPAASPD